MATDYQGIKIYEEVIIVEKESWHWENGKRIKDPIPQGYVVEVGNKKMLETAMNWAKREIYLVGENDNYIYDEKGYHIREVVEGKVNNYKNGEFKFELDEAADGSSQGGKLSFWNCLITAPDNKVYKIGISSEILLNLLKHNTFKNGICESNIWLGRIKGYQVGAFTENMSEFTQAKSDQLFREAKNTKKYSPGAILKNKTETMIYLGEITEYFSVQNNFKVTTTNSNSYYSNYSKNVIKDDVYLVVDDKPHKYHLYLNLGKAFTDISKIDALTILDLARNFDLQNKKYDFPYDYKKEPSKLSRVLVGQVDLSNINIYDYIASCIDATNSGIRSKLCASHTNKQWISLPGTNVLHIYDKI